MAFCCCVGIEQGVWSSQRPGFGFETDLLCHGHDFHGSAEKLLEMMAFSSVSREKMTKS